jgi:MerR family transcriptional regulator, copper efflux regulator
MIEDQFVVKIGALATASGVPIKTIRYYEELGLLKADRRTSGRFRLFSPKIAQRLLFIRRLQSLGLKLQDIGDCLEVYDQGNSPCCQVKGKFEQQVEKIDRQIADLQLLRQELTGLLSKWSPVPSHEPGVHCPNLQM